MYIFRGTTFWAGDLRTQGAFFLKVQACPKVLLPDKWVCKHIHLATVTKMAEITYTHIFLLKLDFMIPPKCEVIENCYTLEEKHMPFSTANQQTVLLKELAVSFFFAFFFFFSFLTWWLYFYDLLTVSLNESNRSSISALLLILKETF